MKTVLSEHKALLKKMIGCSIRFGLMPNLNVESGGCMPDSELYSDNNSYGSFYASHLINLRKKDRRGDQFWITLAPGPDSPIEPWAPFWVSSTLGFNNGGVKKDYSFYVSSIGQKPSGNEDEVALLENEFLNTHVFGFGLNRISKWFDEEKIIQIELYDCAPYAACIIKHNSGKEWCIYAEYDFEFWINFSDEMINGIRESCDLDVVIN